LETGRGPRAAGLISDPQPPRVYSARAPAFLSGACHPGPAAPVRLSPARALRQPSRAARCRGRM